MGGAKGGPGPGSVVLNGPSASAAFGLAVASADLTGDGSRDIVIGGKDKVVLRTADGIYTTVLTAPMGGRAPILTSGDFTEDGTADLAVGYWTNTPFTQSHVRLWAWDATEQAMVNTWNTDNAGVSALAAGDFDGDGHDDLALGECREIADENVDDPCGPEEIAKGGGIHVHYGNATPGSFGFRKQTLNQDTVGVAGVAEAGDRFGAALAVADINNDGRDDLMAGAPGEAIGTRSGAGAATLLFGGPTGLVDAWGEGHSVGFQQDTPRVPGVAEAADAFGAAVATGDYNHDGRADVAVGSPGENSRLGRRVAAAPGERQRLLRLHTRQAGSALPVERARIRQVPQQPVTAHRTLPKPPAVRRRPCREPWRRTPEDPGRPEERLADP